MRGEEREGCDGQRPQNDPGAKPGTTPRYHARYVHDSGDASGTADLVFASAQNGPVMQALGPRVGRTVAELGGSLEADVGGTVKLWVGYDGTFRNGAQSHSAKAGVSVAF